MKKTAITKIDNIDSSTEAEGIGAKTPTMKSDHEIENSPSNYGTFEKVAQEIKAVTSPLARQLEHPFELMRELEAEQSGRSHEETISFRAASSLPGS